MEEPLTRRVKNRAVRILLECILVLISSLRYISLLQVQIKCVKQDQIFK